MTARGRWQASSGPTALRRSLIPRALTRMGPNKERRLEEVSGDIGGGSLGRCLSLESVTVLARWHLGRFTEPRGSCTTQQWAHQTTLHPR